MTQNETLPGHGTDARAPAAYFLRDGDSFVPTWIAQGPWGESISGHVIGGILGWAVERAGGDPELQPARLTVDLPRPTALEPVRVETIVQRDGRRIRLVDAALIQGANVVARASALFLRRGQQPPDEVWSSSAIMPPLPTEPGPIPEQLAMFIQTYGWGTTSGTPGIGKAEWQTEAGPKFAWVRERRLLIDDEPLTPFTRAAMAGDVTSSLTHWGTGGLQFINADFTVTLSRLPEGPYIGLASLTHHSHSGVATGTATILDHRGAIGSGMATALVHPGFRSPFQ